MRCPKIQKETFDTRCEFCARTTTFTSSKWRSLQSETFVELGWSVVTASRIREIAREDRKEGLRLGKGEECAYFFPPLWQGHQQPSGETATFKVKLFFSYDGHFFCKNRKHVTALNEQRKRPRLFKTRTNDFIFEGHGLFSFNENPSTRRIITFVQIFTRFACLLKLMKPYLNLSWKK